MTKQPEVERGAGQAPSPMGKPHILFLFSDTGGGHRAAAEAIIEALHLEYGQALSTEMVDFLKDYAPPPYNRLPSIYPEVVKVPELLGLGYRISDGRPQARIMTSTVAPYVRSAARKLVREHPADLVVSVHMGAISFLLDALGKNRPPFIIVVTDMVSTHALWYDKRAELILVPTRMARERALQNHMPPEKVQVAGQPISERYCRPSQDKASLRRQFGWPPDKFTVLMVGGGEGMGPLAETARAVDESGLDLNLVIVTGRNARLKSRLEAETWENPTFIYGFRQDMPELLRASDAIVTKAGPGTIAEALVAGLPIILYSKLPGQESGNVDYVESREVGVWAPDPLKVVRTLTRWVCRPGERERVVENCRNAARPDASRIIARAIAERVGLAVPASDGSAQIEKTRLTTSGKASKAGLAK